MEVERIEQIRFMSRISISAGARWCEELLEEIDRLREAIQTHEQSTYECPKCGHSESCSTDDVCLVLHG